MDTNKYKKIDKITKVIQQVIALNLLFVLNNFAQATLPIPASPAVAAKNYIMLDSASGKVLAEKNADISIEPASITKMMTAYIVYKKLATGQLKLDDKVTISEKAWRMGGSRMYVDVNSQVSLHDLLKGLIVQSGNDASVAIAEHVAGSETAFVEMMNQTAKQLGMTRTNFINSTGWPDPKHLTTARDIATLASALIKQFPQHYRGYSEKEYSYNGIKQYNRNKLLWRDNSVDGIKTGHTESAGYCLVASAKREGMRIITVVLGTKSKEARASESQKLLNYGFRFYESHTLYKANEKLAEQRVWGGEVDQLAVGVAEDFAIAIPRGSYTKLEAIVNINKNIQAPIEKMQQLGKVKIQLDGKTLAEAPLFALHEIAEGNIFQKIKDYFLHLIE